MPSDVGVLALTAIATLSTLEAVKARLSMKSPVLIGFSPYRDNIYYSVQPYLELEELSVLLAEDLHANQRNTTKLWFFVEDLRNSIAVHIFKKNYLGSILLILLVTQTCNNPSCDGIVRVVIATIATTAFSMGIDCPDIGRTPGTLE